MLSRGSRDAVFRRRETYRYAPSDADPFYEEGRRMKPRRAVMVHSCAVGFEILQNLAIPFPMSESIIRHFHEFNFVSVRPPAPDTDVETVDSGALKIIGNSCPALNAFGQAFRGGSAAISIKLNGQHNQLDGFVYVNDVVLAILELLKFRKRLLYIDIGNHHGDGVEESFFSIDKVMTVVFYRRGDFFPGSGDMREGGKGEGQYALHVPIGDEIDDASFLQIFKCVITKAIEVHNSELILLQCGRQSLKEGDANYFELSDHTHLDCLGFVKSFTQPTILLANSSTCWCFQEVDEPEVPLMNISYNSELVKSFKCSGYIGYVQSRSMDNLNTTQSIEKMRENVLLYLDSLQVSEDAMFYSDPTNSEAQPEDQDFAIEIVDEDYALVKGGIDTLEGRKPWSNIVSCPTAKLMNRFGRKLGSTSMTLMSYRQRMNPYTDFLKYVGDYETGADGNVPPLLSTVANVSRGAWFVSSKAGSAMRLGGNVLGKLGRKLQMFACPEAGSSSEASTGEIIIINSPAEADQQIQKWVMTPGQVKCDVPSDMSLQETGRVFARFAGNDALYMIIGSPVINQKLDRLRARK